MQKTLTASRSQKLNSQRTIDSTEVAAGGFRNGCFTCRDIGESSRYLIWHELSLAAWFMLHRYCLPLTLVALSPLVYIPFSLWISTTPNGTMLFIVGQILYGLFLTAALIATPVLIACLFFQTKTFTSG